MSLRCNLTSHDKCLVIVSGGLLNVSDAFEWRFYHGSWLKSGDGMA